MAIEGFQDLDFQEFHERELPQRLASGNGAEAALAVKKMGSLAFRVPEGQAYTYLSDGDGISIRPGEELADTVIEIDSEIWQGCRTVATWSIFTPSKGMELHLAASIDRRAAIIPGRRTL